MADQFILRTEGWALTVSGVWIHLGEPGTSPVPPTVVEAEAEAAAKSRAKRA